MDPTTLLDNIWLILLLWSALYIGDYYLTIHTADQFAAKLGEHLEFERSFELNPVYEKDVNTLNWFSPRFFLLWILTSALIYLSYAFSHLVLAPWLFRFLAGYLILLEMAIHLRHFRNLALVKSYQPGAITGHLRYAYWFGLQLSAREMFTFSIFCLILAVLLRSWFLAGGAVGNLLMGVRHWVRSKKTYQDSLQAN